MPYLIPCPCGEKVGVEKKQAGSFVQCPACRERLEVPTIRGLSELSYVDDSLNTGGAAAVGQAKWTRGRRVAATLCFVLAVLGLGRSGWYTLQRWSYPVGFDLEQALRLDEERSLRMTPAETWDTWRFLQENGLGKKQPPQELVLARYLEKQDRWMMGLGVVGALAAVGLALAILWPTTARPLEPPKQSR